MPARPSRKPRDASRDGVKGAERPTGSGKGKDLLGSPKQVRQLADAKHRAGSARGR